MQNIKMAYRNLMRHKYRTYLTGATIIILTFIFVFGLSVSNGISEGLIKNIISLNTGDVIITSASNPKSSDTSVENVNWKKQILSSSSFIQNDLSKIKEVDSSTRRLKVTGILSQGGKTSQGIVVGIEASKEKNLFSSLNAKEGTVLPDDSSTHWIYVSTTTADLYHLKVGSLIKVACQTADYKQNQLTFKVCGVFEKSSWKEYYSYISLADAQKLTGAGNNDVTQILVSLKNRNNSVSIAKEINQTLGSSRHLYARDWRSSNDLLLGTVYIMKYSVYGMCVILFLLIATILINNISVAVYERTNEIGILMAMGMKDFNVFSLFLWESFLLSFISTVIGEFLGIIVTQVLNKVGIPAFVEVLRLSFGGNYTYPILHISYILLSFCLIVAFSMFVSVFPIKNALKLDPAVATRQKQ